MFSSKVKCISVLTIICLFISSIFSNPSTVFSMSNTGSAATEADMKATLEKSSSDYVSQFIAGNFADFYNAAADQLKQQITINQLKQGWDLVINATGTPGNIISSTYSQQDGINIVAERVECTRYDIIVTIRYNTEGKSVGIWTSIAPKAPPKAQTTDKWKEVSVTVGEKDLPGMLTLPKGVKNPPVVILIQGSGASDMNETIGTAPNRPFEDIAHGLAERGVATLRYNKRTYQDPSVSPNVVTIEYEILEDAAAAVKMLSSDKRVDKDRIYLLGHSLGGMMAPKITADNPKIKGFISMAGSLRTLQDICLDQSTAAVNTTASLTAQQKEVYIAQAKAELDKVKTLNDGGTGAIAGIPTNYWKSLNAINNVSIVKKLKVPMLILQGGNDFQVYPDIDYKLWKTTLKGHKNVTYHLYEGLSHLFMTNQNSVNGAPDITVYNAPNHVETQVIKDIATWVKSLKK